MGLDWEPLPRPKPGHERTFDELVRRASAGDAEATDALSEISQPVFETLGAPRVGIDEAADAWLRTKVDAASFDRARTRMHGYHVLDLLPECDGFPVYTNYPVVERLDRYAFRAQFLEDVQDVLGDKLHQRAYQVMAATDLAAYGEALMQRARIFARANHVPHVEHVRSLATGASRTEHRGHLLFAAAKWCAYWANRGHGLSPWF